MQKQISENSGYRVFVEVINGDYPKGTKHIRFLTTYDNSKNPNDAQVKFSMALTEQQLEELKNCL
jgi:hypothetical protein